MKRFVSTVVLFGVGVLISYFLSDFYNDINDDNRTNFSRQESITLVDYIDAVSYTHLTLPTKA